MTTGSMKPGDILECEVRGYTFFARAVTGAVERNGRRGIEIEPLKPGQHLITQFVTARQVVGHYAKRKGSK